MRLESRLYPKQGQRLALGNTPPPPQSDKVGSKVSDARLLLSRTDVAPARALGTEQSDSPKARRPQVRRIPALHKELQHKITQKSRPGPPSALVLQQSAAPAQAKRATVSSPPPLSASPCSSPPSPTKGTSSIHNPNALPSFPRGHSLPKPKKKKPHGGA